MTYRHSFTKDPRWDRLMDSLAERALLLVPRQMELQMSEGWVVQRILGDLYDRGLYTKRGPKDWRPKGGRRRKTVLGMDDVVAIMSAQREGLLPEYTEFVRDLTARLLVQAALPSLGDLEIARYDAIDNLFRYWEFDLEEEFLRHLLFWVHIDRTSMSWDLCGAVGVKKSKEPELGKVFKALVDVFWMELTERMESVGILNRYNSWPDGFINSLRGLAARAARDEMVAFIDLQGEAAGG